MENKYTPLTFIKNVRKMGLPMAFAEDLRATARSEYAIERKTESLASKVGFSEENAKGLGSLAATGHALATLPALVAGLAVVVPCALVSNVYKISRMTNRAMKNPSAQPSV
ncbi:MAG: hypothetical protein ABIB47_04790 [Candidatus Woesearchaeota archaeon]